MTMPDVRKEQGATGVTGSAKREEPAPSLHYGLKELLARTWLHERQSPAGSPVTESGQIAGDPRALRAARLLATGALLVTAIIHTRLAFQIGVVGIPLGRGQLFLLNAMASVALALAMFSRNSRVWLFAVVLSTAGLLGILTSVYFPLAALGPFPSIDEPTWLLSKAVCALAEVTVIALWLIRRIAPAGPTE